MEEYRAKVERQIIWMTAGILFLHDHCDLPRQRYAAGSEDLGP